MKNRILTLILTLVLLVTVFTGCGEETETLPGKTDTLVQSGANDAASDNTGSVTGLQEETEGLYPAPDYSDFVMPEATDTLTVYGYDFINGTLRAAIELFEDKYPGVKVEYKLFGQDEYDNILRTEIPAGRGPDILLGGGSELPDIYKSMSTGIFTDFGPYMANDPEYDPSVYYQNIMDGGKLFGKQFLLPVAFDVNCLMTTRELLEENGIDPDGIGTWDAFLDACVCFNANNPGKPLIDYDRNYYIISLIEFCGFTLIDYERNAISFDEDLFRRAMELSRLYCTPEQPQWLPLGGGYQNLPTGECLFANRLGSTANSVLNDCGLLDYYAQQTALILSIPGESGGMSANIEYFSAIPEASPNKLNAWRFTKILLSDEIQYGTEPEGKWPHNAFPVGDAVKRDAFERGIRANQERTGCTDEQIAEYLNLVENVTSAVVLPPMIRKMVYENMKPYVSGETPDYDRQFGKLMNALELYKDE